MVKLIKETDYYDNENKETTRLGFVHDDFFITEPTTDETCRFDVDPIKTYGLTKKQVNRMLDFNGFDEKYYPRLK